MKKNTFYPVFFLLILTTANSYPEIRNLSLSDPLFRQFQSEVEENERRLAQKITPLPLSIYEYLPKEGESLIFIAAKTHITYDTIATLNALSSLSRFASEKLLIPNTEGLFLFPVVPKENSIPLPWEERLTAMNVRDSSFNPTKAKIGMEEVFFFPSESLTPAERKDFLKPPFLYSPIGAGVKLTINSPFGTRIDPIARTPSFHKGLDLKIAMGSPISAVGKGKIIKIGRNSILGLFILIEHSDNMLVDTTLYGHLSQIVVKVGDTVLGGEVIGKSGATGRVTGPHLHFEATHKGKNIDPAPFLLRD